MSLYTRKGDDGTTSLGDGSRASKAGLRVAAVGALDEAASFIGLARVVAADLYLEEVLTFMQHRLLNCTSSLASPVAAHSERTPVITAEDVAVLEAAADRFERRTDPMRGFVLECGCESAARLHVARTVIRRAEREVVALNADEPIAEHILEFLNRCSDVLFVSARWENELAGWPDENWNPEYPAPGSE